MLLFGTEPMFVSISSQRNFFYEFQISQRTGKTSQFQTSVIQLTQSMLNNAAPWFNHGRFSSSGPPPKQMSSPPTSPGKDASASATAAAAASQSESASTATPTAADAVAESGSEQRHALRRAAGLAITSDEVEQIAMINLRRLGLANVTQPLATLFLNKMGVVQHILWARPDSQQLQFMDDDIGLMVEDHLTVLRVALLETGVTMHAPFEELTPAQRAVTDRMRHVLQSFASMMDTS